MNSSLLLLTRCNSMSLIKLESIKIHSVENAIKPHKFIAKKYVECIQAGKIFRSLYIEQFSHRATQRDRRAHLSRARTSLKRRNLSSAESAVAFASFRIEGLGAVRSGYTYPRAS